ncbi:ATP-binding protein [Actinomadura rupiterrae]|uniref:ATP-binding protein n=1 Tax=Actinomadura rupiterrae TaxID=559627 RepID=UPI0020A28F50|nr:ATP-binding protein [Actinomadura rupiterrae]MCP2338053.1 anti-sigma regulatory factor (Ser/Thr protein kinase) [Actinomadura rupiterrae]
MVLLPHAPSSVAVARRRLGSELTASGVDSSVIDDASVIVSELISNALRHARPLPSGQVRVTWTRRGDLIEISVSDGGATTEPRRGPGTLSSLGGRGLGIVETLAEGWGVRREDGATTVWARLYAPRFSIEPRMAAGALPDLKEIADLPDPFAAPDADGPGGVRHETSTSRAYPG